MKIQKKELLNHDDRDFCLNQHEQEIFSRQMPSCTIAKRVGNQWNVLYGDKAFSYNTYEKVLEVLRKQKFIVLYENGNARLFDTAEELARFYIEIVRECQCDIDDILMRLDVLLANNNMFINLLEAAVNYKEKK